MFIFFFFLGGAVVFLGGENLPPPPPQRPSVVRPWFDPRITLFWPKFCFANDVTCNAVFYSKPKYLKQLITCKILSLYHSGSEVTDRRGGQISLSKDGNILRSGVNKANKCSIFKITFFCIITVFCRRYFLSPNKKDSYMLTKVNFNNDVIFEWWFWTLNYSFDTVALIIKGLNRNEKVELERSENCSKNVIWNRVA